MTIKIYYDASQHDGGSPFWASHKMYDRVADNAIVCSSEVEDDANSTDWETPCVQNSVNGFVLISGPHDYYDVVVTVTGTSTDIAQRTGTGRVTGGLGWRFDDQNGSAFAKGMHKGGSVAGTGTPTAVTGTFLRRIPNNKRVRVCSCSANGGIQIAPNAGNFYVSTKTLLSMTWSVAFLLAWSYTDVPNGSGGAVTIPIPHGVGTDITTGRISFGEALGENFEVYTRPSRLGAEAVHLVPMDYDFQDPELKRSVGEAAQILDNPKVKQKLERAIERQSKSGRHRAD